MRVGIDDQIFRRQPWGGISRIFVEMAKVWQDTSEGVSVTPLFGFARSRMVADAFPGVRVLDLPDNPLGSRAFTALNGRQRMHASRCDVIQHTFFDRRALTTGPQARVTHVYDMIDEANGGLPDWYDKRAFVDASDVVVCISEVTRTALLQHWPIEPDKVKTVLLGATPELAKPAPRPPGLPANYALYVGNRGSYKSFALLVDALAGNTGLADLHVLAVGGGSFSPPEVERLASVGLHTRFHQMAVSEPYLPGVYQHASVVVQTSRAEGFGLPVLEGMTAGTPVIAADIPVVREVGDDAIRTFEAGNSASLAEALTVVLGDPAVAEDLRSRGRRRAAGFSWRATATATHAAYEEAMERRGA